MSRTYDRKKQGGFTLLEIMIVVVIVGVLAAIALAAYQRHVVKARRSTAAVCLQERAQFMERFYTTNMTYAGAPNPAQCGNGLDAFYTIAFSGTPSASAFTLTATPKGIQASKDTECATLSLNEKGVRGVTGTSAATQCW